MSIRLTLPKVTDLKPRITVIGVGGAGGNAINNMIAAGLSGVTFIVANTDAQALSHSTAEHRIQLGTNLTEGLGAGSKPEIGEAAAEEAIDDIRAAVSGSHMLFIAAGMGGGTGTGAAAVIARIARELGVLTVAVVTKPFQFEGQRRARIAEAGVAQLKGAVDTLIVIPNQNLFRISTEQTTFAEAFVLADQVLYSGIACIVDLIVKEGLINLDLADVKTVLAGMGTAMMGTGEASGDDRARLAAEEAINNPLLDEVSLKGARGLLVSIIGSQNLTLYEVDAAASRVRQEVDPDANIIVGATFDESLGDRVRVSIVASGMAISGADASALPFAPSRAGAIAGKGPPPLPGAPSQGSSLDWRLSEAVEPGRGYDIRSDGVLPHAAARGGVDASLRAHAGSVDGQHGGLTIEERAPKLPGGIAAGRRPAAGAATESMKEGARPGAGGASGAPTPGQRIPDLTDFPPLAQREYRSRTEGSGAQRGASDNSRPAAGEARKPSLLQRLTGAGKQRKADEEKRSEPPHGELPGFLARGK